MENEFKFQVGDRVDKVVGYQFPGTVVSVFVTTKGRKRVVVEMDNYELLHIFNEDNLIFMEDYLLFSATNYKDSI